MTKLVRKLWVGLGVVSVAGAAGGAVPTLAQHAGHDVATSTAKQDPAAVQPPTRVGQGGEGYLAGNGPADSRIRVLRDLSLIRGHLLVGGELIAEGLWDEALSHFLHPTEEIYGNLDRYITLHGVAPFDGQMKALAQAVKARRIGAYRQALKVVDERLDGAFSVFKTYMNPLPRTTIKAVVAVLEAAAGEYASAIEDGRFTKPVEYQDGRGFVLHAERMIDGVARELGRTNQQALAEIRVHLAELKRAWPGPMPPPAPLVDAFTVAAIVARIEARSAAF